MPGYYDYILALIPASFLAITATLTSAGVPLTIAVGAGSVSSVGLVGHALFIRSPTSVYPTKRNTPADATSRDTPSPQQTPQDHNSLAND